MPRPGRRGQRRGNPRRSGSRNILCAPSGTGKTVFAIQCFLHIEPYEEDPCVLSLDLNRAHNVFVFPFHEEAHRREMRIVKMERCAHPLERMPLEIAGVGLTLKRGRH